MKTEIQKFTFNPFQENTYVLYDDSKEAVIVDPGCYEKREEQELVQFIEDQKLNPVRLIQTHCHVDHMLGNDFLFRKYHLKPWLHRSDLPVLQSTPQYGALFGLNVTPSPEPEGFFEEGDVLEFGQTRLEILFVPGHSPGHVVFYNKQQEFMIAGDVLFYGSIGRTDLPYADHDTLIRNIKEKLLTLPSSVEVHPGHGPSTDIGFEKSKNPFLT